MIDLGTQYKLSVDCRLARGNIPFPGLLGLLSEPKTSQSNLLVELKV